ncbi:MAG: peptide ABC transporter ATP-binding protein, partial [Oscillospiraceae bacterium]|nr:peptide ABC transporter ATP-binding protein [Oscillospiraceae bacterium]
RSIPTADTAGTRLQPITGTPIDLLNMPKGCPFAPRCDNAMKICLRERCERMVINADHMAACWMNVKEAVKEGGEDIG